MLWKIDFVQDGNMLISTPERIRVDIYYLITRKELNLAPAELESLLTRCIEKG